MIACSEQKNQLVRNGTSQSERYARELLPSYIPVDEKTIADILTFIQYYAELINYYNLSGAHDGNWQVFFKKNDTILLALISTAKTKNLDDSFNEFFKDPASANLDDIITTVYGIASEIQNWNILLNKNSEVQKYISSLIQDQLRDKLLKLISYDKDNSPVSDYASFYDSDWDLNPGSFTAITSRPPDVEGLKSLFRFFLQGRQKIISKATVRFQNSIQNSDDHKPHIALLIAFINIYKYAQDHINTITKRHLDYYYTEILQLIKNDQVPDRVHIIFELAKNQLKALVKKGTLLKAGKDDSGKELLYELGSEIVVNTARIQELKTIFIDTSQAPGQDPQYRIHAAPDADSTDGKGTDFETEDDRHWGAFGNTDMPHAYLGFAIASPVLLMKEGDRNITLKLKYTGSLTATDSALENAFKIQLSSNEEWVDIEPGNVTDTEKCFVVTNNTSTGELVFDIQLFSGDPPVVCYDGDTLDGSFNTKWPVVKVLLNPDAETYGYYLLKDLQLLKVTIDVKGNYIKDLIIQNDSSKLNAEETFLPFGPTPVAGSNFYIGSAEVFSKKLNKLCIILDWLDFPESGSLAQHYYVYNLPEYNKKIDNKSFKANIFILDNREWELADQQQLFKSQDYNSSDFSIFLERFEQELEMQSNYAYVELSISEMMQEVRDQVSQNASFYRTLAMIDSGSGESETKERESNEKANEESITVKTTNKVVLKVIDPENGSTYESPDRYEGVLDIDIYDIDTQRGFLRLELTGKDFQHSCYNEIYTKQAILIAKNPFDATILLPNKPYTPAVSNMYLYYESTQEIDLSADSESDYKNRVDQVFHIYPFGQKEIHKYIDQDNLYFLPQFNISEQLYTGNLFIGLKDARPSQAVSVLFQVYDGSGDPELEVPAIDWYYLVNNKWKKFEDYQVSPDTSKGLVKSGITRFTFPSDISTGNSILDKSLYWIRGGITGNVDAIPELIDVAAQAGEAGFADNKNSLTHLATALKAESISKLASTNVAIKSVEQPYSSFDGRVKETDNEFYRRVSERLRHKDRAITIWDYERLVLEEFPSIHKAKCINHTNQYTEIAPGYVMLVVIPDIRDKNYQNLYEPKVDQGTLQDISDFLVKKNTLFVKGNQDVSDNISRNKLLVLNPLYEKVRVICDVKFNTGYDPSYYKQVLNDDIKKYLAPWAYDEGSEISFGNKLHRSVILNYIEEQAYVDYLINFSINHILHDGSLLENVEEIITSTARSIITTYFTTNGSEEHCIRDLS